MRKLLLQLNLAAILPTVLFCIYLKSLPEQYRPYIDGILMLAVAVMSAGPFIINYYSVRRSLNLKRGIGYLCLFLCCLMLFINGACLFVMYMDQFSGSRGFALLGSATIFSAVFLPIWIIFLISLRIAQRSN